MLLEIKILSQSKDLLFSWTSRIIHTRYQQSLLGGLWIIIQPAATVALFSVIFTFFIPINTAPIPYIIFSYSAVIPWTFLSSSITDMTSSIVGNMGLVTKIYFPRQILPIASMLARLLDFGVAYILLFILMLIYQVPISIVGLVFLPVIVIVQIALIIGVGLIGAAVNVFYRDVSSMLTLLLQLWFYASPIIYPITSVPERLRLLYFLNPMAGILESYRDVLLRGTTPGAYFLPSVVISLILFFFGYYYFKRVEYLFADII